MLSINCTHKKIHQQRRLWSAATIDQQLKPAKENCNVQTQLTSSSEQNLVTKLTNLTDTRKNSAAKVLQAAIEQDASRKQQDWNCKYNLTSSSWWRVASMFDSKATIPEQWREKTRLSCEGRSVASFSLLDQRKRKRIRQSIPVVELQMQIRAPQNRAHNLSWSGDQGVATVAQGVNWGKLLNALQDQQVNNWGNNDTGMGRYGRLYSEDWQRDSRTNEASRPHSCTRLFLMPLVQQGREATPRAEALGRASLWKD